MSRIGRKPIPVPYGVDVTVDGQHVVVKGPKGSSSTRSPRPSRSPGKATSWRSSARPTGGDRSLHGLSRTLVSTMVPASPRASRSGLEIIGVGYRPRRRPPTSWSWRWASRTPCPSTRPPASPSRCRRPTAITVKGIDKQLVGQVAADIRKIRKPEPYKGKGVRYAGEKVLRKAGKTGK